MFSKTRVVAAVGIAAGVLWGAQSQKAGGYAAFPLRAGPVYSPEKPAKTVDIVVDLAPPPELKGTTPNGAQVKESARLLEDKKITSSADQVQPFSETRQAAALAIAIDVSAGMNGERLRSVQRGLLQVVGKKRDIDKVALLAFGTEVKVLTDFNASGDALRAAIEKLRVETADNPRLYRALDQSLKLFLSQDSTLPARRRILVVGQGKNPGPEAGGDAGFQANDVIAQAVRMQIPIDAIGVQAPPPAMNDSQKLAIIVFGGSDGAQKQSTDPLVFLENMERLATRTGGMYSKHLRTDKDLGQRLADGVHWLMNSPVLRFRVQNLPFDGKSHSIGVRIGNTDIDPAGTALLYTDEGLGPIAKKYGYYILGALVLLALLILGLQGRRKPVRRQVHTPGHTPRSTTPAPAMPESGNSPRPAVRVPPPPQPAFAPPGAIGQQPNRPRGVPETPPRRSGTVVVNSSFTAPAPGQPSCSLLVTSGSHAGTRLPVETEQAVVGRGLGHAISCAFDPAISDPHAQIRFQGGLVLLIDLNSSNGTYLNGTKLTAGQPASLNLGDRIHMGQTDFQVV